jgi:DNA-binding NarL/FixJ family response regulator
MSDSIQSAERSAREPEGAARVKTVLVVDDAESERTAIRTAIESRTKFRVCGEASNGVDAIRKAQELRPDLVLMDLAMPQMNSLEAAKVLRNTMPTVPVVLLTLHADLIRGPRSSVFGVSLVLSKDEGLAPLLRCLERLLGRKS